jgi:hypothetical protein
MVKLVFERFTSRDRSKIECAEYFLERKCNRLVERLFSLQYDLAVKEENGVVTFTFTPDKTFQTDDEVTRDGKD